MHIAYAWNINFTFFIQVICKTVNRIIYSIDARKLWIIETFYWMLNITLNSFIKYLFKIVIRVLLFEFISQKQHVIIVIFTRVHWNCCSIKVQWKNVEWTFWYSWSVTICFLSYLWKCHVRCHFFPFFSIFWMMNENKYWKLNSFGCAHKIEINLTSEHKQRAALSVSYK